MRILYVNHTGQMSGAEHSLLSLLLGLPESASAAVACPEGPFAEAARRGGVEVHPIPSAEGSLRLHPIETSRGVLAFAQASASVRRIWSDFRADIVHANSIRAGVVASLATGVGGPPEVVYVRDCLPPGRVSSMALGLIAARAAAVMPNSRYTAASFERVRAAQRMRVAYSPVDLERFDPTRFDRSEARRALGLDDSTPVLAVIAQLTPWKGQDDAIRVTGLLRERYPDIRLLLVGTVKFLSQTTRYDNEAYRAWLGKLTDALGLQDSVLFMGERGDVPSMLAATDVLMVPSWEEPFGRAIIEAMAMERPVVATDVGGPTEVIQDGETGVLLPPRRPELWAAAVERLLDEPERRMAMARRAREEAASRFSVERHVDAIVSTYEELLSRDGH